MGKLSGTFYGVPRSSRHRQSPFSGIGHLWRTGMLNGIHHRLLIQIGNDSYDIYDVCVAFFIVHGNDPFAVKELAFVYLVVFVLMYIIGPGKFAVDRWISQSLSRK